MNNNSNRFQEIDALRGIAALMVIFFHFTMGRTEAKLGFKIGMTGVELFFIISGFVIFMSLNKVKTSRDFIINRISRLYPTYWTCVTFTFILISIYKLSINDDIPICQYLGNMTMFQYYLRIKDLDGPYWTMIIEMVFYIGILSLYHFKMLRYLNLIGITLSLMTVIFTFCLSNTIVNKILMLIPFLNYTPLFYAGTIFYEIYYEKSNTMKNYFLIIMCLICQIILSEFTGRSNALSNHIDYSIMLTLYFFLFTLFVNGKLKFIVSKTTLFLGNISFALYLIHQYISIGIIIPTLINEFNINFWISSICISLPIVIALAAFVTYYIEVPFNRKMKEYLRARWV